jgi:hypothetical protein
MTITPFKENKRAYELRKRIQTIRDSYDDGIPLRKSDKTFMLEILRMHPKAEIKFGCGINAIVVHTFIGGSRCFFVIRADGTIEDFSYRKCLNMPIPKRSERLQIAMQRFNYGIVYTKYRMFLFKLRIDTRNLVQDWIKQ